MYFCTHFLIEIDEKSSHNSGFKYDLMMISNMLTFWGPPCIFACAKNRSWSFSTLGVGYFSHLAFAH